MSNFDHLRFGIATRSTLTPMGNCNAFSAPTSGATPEGCDELKLGSAHPSGTCSSSFSRANGRRFMPPVVKHQPAALREDLTYGLPEDWTVVTAAKKNNKIIAPIYIFKRLLAKDPHPFASYHTIRQNPQGGGVSPPPSLWDARVRDRGEGTISRRARREEGYARPELPQKSRRGRTQSKL